MVADGLPKTIATRCAFLIRKSNVIPAPDDVGIVALNIVACYVYRVWTKKALWCTRMHPDDIRKIHIADLRTKFGNQGLDIIGESCHNVSCNVIDVVTRDWWWGVM